MNLPVVFSFEQKFLYHIYTVDNHLRICLCFCCSSIHLCMFSLSCNILHMDKNYIKIVSRSKN